MTSISLVRGIKRAAGLPLRKLRYAFLLIKRGGLPAILRYLLSRLFSRTTYVWLANDMTSSDARPRAKMPYTLQMASPDTFRQLLDSVKGESGATKLEVLRRLSFYQRGFDTCHVALTKSGEPCFLQWLLYPRQNKLIRASYPFRMRELKEDEAMIENAFTSPRYRGKGLMSSVNADQVEIARNQGFKRVVAQVGKENGPSLGGCYRAGFKTFAEQEEIRLLFMIWRRKWVP